MTSADPDARLRELLAPGQIFEQKYRVVSELGTGSFAIVVKARHEVMGRDVALKCLKPSVVRSTPEVSERFVNEVQIVSRLRHPNSVTIFDFGRRDDNLAYMVLEYLDGQTLDEKINVEGPLGEQTTVRICRQILNSLSEAHTQGIVHRDLKPSNIMLTELHGESTFVKVLDFGVAKLLDDAESRGTSLAPRSTQFIGTPVYMSPEQVLGQPVDAASDLYSLGLLAYEMLTGRPPIAEDNVASVVREHLDDRPLPLDGLDALSDPMARLIGKATARQPAQRFGNVEQFGRALPGDGRVAKASPQTSAPAAAGRESAPKASPASAAKDTSESDVFSGANYLGPPAADTTPAKPRRSADRPSRPAPAPNAVRRPDDTDSALGGGELDLDLDSVHRQRRDLQRRRRRNPSPDRRVDGGWEAREYLHRALVYGAGIVGGFWSFVILAAMLHRQPSGVRLGAGVLVVVSAVMSARFSGRQAVGLDIGHRWLLPTAKNMLYIGAVVVVVGLVWCPADVAAGLRGRPAWFLDALPQSAPVRWLGATVAAIAAIVARLFEFMAGVLPY